jgi:hypothetical protein
MAVAILCNARSANETALWRIEWQTFAAMVTGFPGIPAIPEEKPAAFVPPQAPGRMAGHGAHLSGDRPMGFRPGAAGTLPSNDGQPEHRFSDTPLGPWDSGMLADRALLRDDTHGGSQRRHRGLLRLQLKEIFHRRYRRWPSTRPSPCPTGPR